MRRALLVLALAACHQTTPPRVVAEIFAPDHRRPVAILDEPTFRMAVARQRMLRDDSVEAAALPASLRDDLLDQLIEERILLAEAKRLDIKTSTAALATAKARVFAESSTTEVARRLIDTYQTEKDLEARMEARLLVAALLRREAHQGVAVSDEELARGFQAIPQGERAIPMKVRARHIVVRTEEEGRKVAAELKRGVSFDALAREHSMAPEARDGGDLGWFGPGVMPKVFDVCFDLKVGEATPLIASEYGFHLFRVEAIAPARALTFEEAAPKLRAQLMTRKLEEAEAAYRAAVMRKYRVKKNDVVLQSIE